MRFVRLSQELIPIRLLVQNLIWTGLMFRSPLRGRNSGCKQLLHCCLPSNRRSCARLKALHFALSAACWGATVCRRWLRNFHSPYKIPATTKPRYIHMMVVLQPAR